MNRIKVINDPVDLILIIHAVNSEEKKKVFQELSSEWLTAIQIKEKYHEKGLEALYLLDKLKLIESRWQTSKDNVTEKAYHTYFVAFQISITSQISEIIDIMASIAMPEKEFIKMEKKLLEHIGNEWKFYTDIAKSLNISPTMVKCIAKRSSKLEVKGHKVGKAVGLE